MVCAVKTPQERGLTAQRLIDLRKAAGFTNQKAAAAHVRKLTGVVGLTDSQWAAYEAGDPRRPFQQKHRDAIESVFGPLNDQADEEAATPEGMAALISELRETNRLLAQQNAINTRTIEFLVASFTGRTPPVWFQLEGGGAVLAVQTRLDRIDDALQRLLASSQADTRDRGAEEPGKDESARTGKGPASR